MDFLIPKSFSPQDSTDGRWNQTLLKFIFAHLVLSSLPPTVNIRRRNSASQGRAVEHSPLTRLSSLTHICLTSLQKLPGNPAMMEKQIYSGGGMTPSQGRTKIVINAGYTATIFYRRILKVLCKPTACNISLGWLSTLNFQGQASHCITKMKTIK